MYNSHIRSIDQALNNGPDPILLQQLGQEVHPAVLASRLQESDPERATELLLMFNLEDRALVLSHFRRSFLQRVAGQLSDSDLADIVEVMAHDDRVDLFRLLPAQRHSPLLQKVPLEDRHDIERLLAYPEDCAGSVMTSDFVGLSAHTTADEALKLIRKVAKDRETIYYAYVLDTSRKLLGMVSLKDLLLVRPQVTLEEVMFREVIVARASEKRETVANRLSEYDLIAMPVLDETDRMVGIITFDDVMDVRQEEATTDFHKMGSVGLMNMSLKDAGVWLLFLKRAPWLLVLVFMNIFSGAGIAYFEDTIEAVVALVFFLPLLIDSGGNAGSQSATLMVRALAIGDVRIRDWFKLAGKEVLVAISIGVAMGIAVSFIGYYRAGSEVAVVVAMTMIIVVLFGSIMGMSMPFILQRFRFDPATASAPLITSVADIAGVLIYFGIATWYLGIGS